jgi:hypothetical protein
MLDHGGVITQMFYGKQIEVITASETDGRVSSQSTTVPFGQISLNVNLGNLFSAWNDAFNA